MKRLIRKSTVIDIPPLREEVKLTDDPAYEGLDMNAMSRPENRDGAVLVDTQNGKLHIGLNGETHAQLLEQHFEIPKDSNDSRLDIDSYVAPGIYLKNFLGHETIILYSYNPGAEEVILQEKPGTIVYDEDYFEETLVRIAKK